MDSPLGFTFFKKVEIYQLVKSLDHRSGIQLKLYPKAGGTSPTWPIEKKILRWSYLGHVHLLTPLQQKWLYEPKDNNKNLNKLMDMGIDYDVDLMDIFGKLSIEDREKKVKLVVSKAFENLIHRGFATRIPESVGMSGENLTDHIYITNEGLLVGELLSEIESRKKILYWFWGKLFGHAGAILVVIGFLLLLLDPLLKPLLLLFNLISMIIDQVSLLVPRLTNTQF